MTAAVRAAELGAKVIVLEKMPEEGIGGSSRHVNVMFAAREPESPARLADEVFAASVTYHRHACNEKVLRTYLQNSGATLDWLIAQGVDLAGLSIDGTEGVYLYEDTAEVGSQGGGGSGIRSLYARGRNYGVEFLFETPVEALIMKDGVVAGVTAVTASGCRIAVNAPVVVLATGGYGDSKEMFEQLSPFVDYENLRSFGVEGHTGDGIRLGLSAGAALHCPSAVNFCGPSLKGEREDGTATVVGLKQQPCVWVNERAARFTNEATIQDWTLSANAISQQHKMFSIVDAAFLTTIQNEGVFLGEPMTAMQPGNPVPVAMEAVEKKVAESNPVVFKASTIEALAEALGLDPQALNETVETYNNYVVDGRDLDFGKPAKWLLPIAQAPFYGFQAQLAFFNTIGGLRVDERLRVMSKETGRPIPGLYATGSDAAAIYGFSYDISIAPGTHQGWCNTSALLAAEDAVRVYLNA